MRRSLVPFLLAILGLLGQMAVEVRYVVTGDGQTCSICLATATTHPSEWTADGDQDCGDCCVQASRPTGSALTGGWVTVENQASGMPPAPALPSRYRSPQETAPCRPVFVASLSTAPPSGRGPPQPA